MRASGPAGPLAPTPVFRQRLAVSGTRAEVDIDDLLELGAAAWAESEMETAWVDAGRKRIDFHAWLDEPREGDPATYREALDQDLLDFVRAAFDVELAA